MFDRYVADKKRRRPLLYAAFVGSSILEAGLIVFFVIYSFIHVDEVQPPPLTVQFIAQAPPPPPPPPPKAAPKKQVTPPKVVKPVVQPTVVPQMIQPKNEPEPPEKEDTGSGEGVPGGVEGGVAGGVVGAPPAPPPKEEPKPPPKPKTVPAILIKKDKISSGDDPHLPDVVKAQRRGSTVTGSYKVCIAQSGSISSVDVVQSIPGADESIVSTLRGWRYKPQTIPICFIQFLEFQIE
jgi:protein TonB